MPLQDICGSLDQEDLIDPQSSKLQNTGTKTYHFQLESSLRQLGALDCISVCIHSYESKVTICGKGRPFDIRLICIIGFIPQRDKVVTPREKAAEAVSNTVPNHKHKLLLTHPTAPLPQSR